MKKCDWVGPVCIMNKEADRVIALEVTPEHGEPFEVEASSVVLLESGMFVNGFLVTEPTRVTPILEPGREIIIRRGCSKRPNHHGEHGLSRWRSRFLRLKSCFRFQR